MARPDLRLSRVEAVPAPTVLSLDELAEGSWVLREPGSGTRSAFEETLAQRGFNPTRLTVML